MYNFKLNHIKISTVSTTVLLCLLCLLTATNANGQRAKNTNLLSSYDRIYDKRYLAYSRWRLHFNNVLYRPAYAKKLQGVYDIDPQPMRGYNFGVQYTFKRANQLSYYIGADIDFIPFYYYYYEVPPNEFPEGTPVLGYVYYKDINSHSVLTIPLGFSWKLPSNNNRLSNFDFEFKGDLRLHIIQPGGMSLTSRRGEVWYFNVFGDTKPLNILSPTINLSAGVNWLTKIAILNLNFNLQKGVMPYLQGEYSFFNLLEAPDTKGIYKVRADYIGVDVGITPKKWRKKYR